MHKPTKLNSYATEFDLQLEEYFSSNHFYLEISYAKIHILRLGGEGDIKIEIEKDGQILRDPITATYDRFLSNRFPYGVISDTEIEFYPSGSSVYAENLGNFIGGRDNYTHFLTDFLPRAYLNKQGIQSVVYSNDYQRDMLVANGFVNISFLDIDKLGKAIYANGMKYSLSPGPMSWIKELYAPRLKEISKGNGILLWKGVGNKRVENEEKLFAMCRRLNVEIYEPANHSFKDVIRRVHSASFIIAIGDGSLGNLLFAGDETPKLVFISDSMLLSTDISMRLALRPLLPIQNLTICGCKPSLGSKASSSPAYSSFEVDLKVFYDWIGGHA